MFSAYNRGMANPKMKSAQLKQRYAKRVRRAITYLCGTPIDKESLVATISILKVLSVGTERGWLYPEEIAKLTKLTAKCPAKKYAVTL